MELTSMTAKTYLNYFLLSKILNILFWWLDGEVTPDPIPNSAVKLASGDDTPCGESS